MTFVEAAIEILKREGKPLSSRRLAELAVKLNLLSVVGRDPEATMQQRLDDALSQAVRHPDLVRLKPDTFGLHAYPPRSEPSNGAAAATGEAAVEAGAGEPKRGRRRRRGRGRRGEDAPPGAQKADAEAEAEAEGAGGEAEDAADAGEAGTPAAAAAGGAAPAIEGGGDKRRRRRRGGRGRRRREGSAPPSADAVGEATDEADDEADAGEVEAGEVEAGGAEAALPMPAELPAEAEAGGTAADVAAVAEAELLDEEGAPEELEADVDHDTGPLMAPAFGAEDVTRTDEDRTVRPEIRGSRDDRRGGRHHKDRRDRHKDRDAKKQEHKAHEPRAHEPRAHEPRAHEPRAHEPRAHEPRPPAAEPRAGAPGERGLLDAMLEVLRAGDGRPTHVRHLVEAALKRRLVDERTPPADLVRLARLALWREGREREADGLRPRVRAAGAGHYAPVDRKLDPELAQAERELGERANRLRDATRAALRRRLGRMSPAAFEALGRTLCERLGIVGLELIRRGEGVTYWGGSRARGAATVRTLVALRPGEAEVGRRAVGELRAGLAAKVYDEGFLLAAGRPGGDAIAELKPGGVTLYDGAAVAGLLLKHGLGVRRVALPLDYLDLDFFAELTEG